VKGGNTLTNRKPLLTAALAAAAVALAGCGSSAEPKIPASSKLVAAKGNTAAKIVLTAQGAQRIGLQTATARTVPTAPPATTATSIIPFASVVYAPSGQAYAFTRISPLTYTEVPLTIDRISGDSVYLLKGPRAGSKVVTVGAEELFGVQTGVLAQT
jgi:hypothetical protein